MEAAMGDIADVVGAWLHWGKCSHPRVSTDGTFITVDGVAVARRWSNGSVGMTLHHPYIAKQAMRALNEICRRCAAGVSFRLTGELLSEPYFDIWRIEYRDLVSLPAHASRPDSYMIARHRPPANPWV